MRDEQDAGASCVENRTSRSDAEQACEVARRGLQKFVSGGEQIIWGFDSHPTLLLYYLGMNHEDYFKQAAKAAEKSLCLRDKCGAFVVLNAKIIGKGYNGPACDNIADRKCNLDLTTSPKPKSDRTCCLHAEWRAIIDAIRKTGDIDGSTLYFSRVDDNGGILPSGLPYCTVCSRLALDNGIKYFALRHDLGPKLYDTYEYNELSYRFHQN